MKDRSKKAIYLSQALQSFKDRLAEKIYENSFKAFSLSFQTPVD